MRATLHTPAPGEVPARGRAYDDNPEQDGRQLGLALFEGLPGGRSQAGELVVLQMTTFGSFHISAVVPENSTPAGQPSFLVSRSRFIAVRRAYHFSDPIWNRSAALRA